jgi:histidinol dehydrogenase
MVLKIVTPADVSGMHFDPVDPKAREQSAVILETVKTKGLDGLMETAVRLQDLESLKSKLFYTRDDLKVAYEALSKSDQQVLKKTNTRIKAFAESQRASIKEMTTDISGGQAGHFIAPVLTAGCYAPGGRYPLPSSVMMTATTARAAGVKTVWVVSRTSCRISPIHEPLLAALPYQSLFRRLLARPLQLSLLHSWQTQTVSSLWAVHRRLEPWPTESDPSLHAT